MTCLKNDLERAEKISIPVSADKRAIFQCHRLIAHRKSPDPYVQLLIHFDIHSKSLVQILRRTVKVVEHVICEIPDAVTGGASNRVFVLPAEAPVIKRNSKGINSDTRELLHGGVLEPFEADTLQLFARAFKQIHQKV